MAQSQIPRETPEVRIRGTQEGLLITIPQEAPQEWLEHLIAELERKKDFWRGGRVLLSLADRALSLQELKRVCRVIEEYGMTLRSILTENPQTIRFAREMRISHAPPPTPWEENLRRAVEQKASPQQEQVEDLGEEGLEDIEERQAVSEEPSPGEDSPVEALQETGKEAPQSSSQEAGEEEMESIQLAPGVEAALWLRKTLRSGGSVRHDGPVVILGDVNPGAEVIADGDVIVWGRVRGLIHAGASGDQSCVICALDLNPTQLRIADKIAIPPQEKRSRTVPEMALVRNGQIIAEPWRVKS